jgi:hypothetical protein
MNDKDEEAFFEVWFQLQRREHFKSLYPTEAFHENWGLGSHDAMLKAWMARASLHVTPAKRKHDYTSPRCWCGEANNRSQSDRSAE